ncbi:hypothetical protein QOT17_004947 [Balamuthia mandrillaris]
MPHTALPRDSNGNRSPVPSSRREGSDLDGAGGPPGNGSLCGNDALAFSGRLPPPLPRRREQSPPKKRVPIRRVGAEKLKHNAAERKRKLIFNAKLEELKQLTPNLSPSSSKRTILEEAVNFIRELVAERQFYHQLIFDVDKRLQQQPTRQYFSPSTKPTTTPSALPLMPSPVVPRREVLPPIRVALAQEDHGWPSATSPPASSSYLPIGTCHASSFRV